MAERFLRLPQIAALLGTSPKYLREKRCRGKFSLPLVRIDRMLGCRESVYQQWLEESGRVA
jgi:predicted DNA-binding transcriptional regulator AlpA